MSHRTPAISTDQVEAYVCFARVGSIRGAAREMHLSVEGMRARLQSLEARLGHPLYRIEGSRPVLTAFGRHVQRLAPQWLELARALALPGGEHSGESGAAAKLRTAAGLDGLRPALRVASGASLAVPRS